MLVNGVSSEKTVTGEVILEEAVNTIKTVGTKKVQQAAAAVTTSSSVKCISTLTPSSPIQLDKNGVPVKYKSKMTARATAYTYTGNNCSTGVAPQPGYIAVNPKVIPYGTKMYIKLEQYKIFNEAATTLSFSIAARNLFISQSAVSQTISSIEKELQTQFLCTFPQVLPPFLSYLHLAVRRKLGA